MRLRDLAFADLYICANPELGAHWSRALHRPSVSAGGDGGVIPVPLESEPDVAELRQRLAKQQRVEFQLLYDGVSYRVATLPDVFATWWVLRRGVVTLPRAGDLGLDPNLTKSLIDVGGRYGLMLVAGAPGSGKTTTSSTLLASWLEHYGSIAVTVEDPPELPLSGPLGKGMCYQIEVENDDWDTPLKKVFRFAAKYLFLGEIRSPLACAAALKAAARGTCVIATVHAGQVEEAMQVMKAFAQVSEGELGLTLLAETLSAVIVTSLATGKLTVQSLFAGEGSGDQVRGLIREGKFHMLSSVIQQQDAIRQQDAMRRRGHGANIPGPPPMPMRPPIIPPANAPARR